MGFNDMSSFPDRFKRDASHAIAASFRHPEITNVLSHMERQKLVDTLVGVFGTREGLMGTYESIRHSDITQTILDVITDDAFYTNEGDMFTVSYDEGKENQRDTQKKVNEIIDTFVHEFNIAGLVRNVLDDFLLFGEYPLRVVVSPNNKGVIDIKDDLDPVRTVGIYQLDNPSYFLEKSERGWFVRDPKEIIHFNLSPTKIRIKMFDVRNQKKQLPEYIRIGKSILYPALQKIKQLQTIELASMITDLKRAIAPILISVAVPANSQPDDVTEIVKKYEQHLREVYRGMPDLENPSMADLLATVTNFRVVPNFTDGKGVIQTLDVIGDQTGMDDRIDRLRRNIAMAIGMPPYYLVTGIMENSQTKVEMLKLHSRYSRMLASIQEAIATGIRKLVTLHIINKNIFINPEHIKVQFKAIINVEHLDKMEYTVASAQTLRDVNGVLQDILSNDEVKAKLNNRAYIDLVNKFFSAGVGSDEPILLPLTEEEERAETLAAGGGMEGGGGGGGFFGGGGGADFGGGSVEEAPMFEPEGPDAGSLAADAMENQDALAPADFGDVDLGDVEAPEEESTLGDLA